MSSGGGGTTSTNTVQSADPWAGVQPYLSQAYGNLANIYNKGTPQYYPGQTVAGITQPTQSAIDYTNALAGAYSGPNGISNKVISGFNNIVNPNTLDVANNPIVQAQANAATQPIIEKLQQQVLPTLDSQAVMQGAYSGVRPGIAKVMATDAATQDAMNAAANVYGNAYNSGLDAYTKTLLGAPSTFSTLSQPLSSLYQAGNVLQGQNQQEINAAMQQYNYNQNADWARVQQYLSALSGTPWGTNTTGTYNPSTYSNPWLGAAGGAATGASLGAMTGLEYGGGWGALIGALAGYALS